MLIVWFANTDFVDKLMKRITFEECLVYSKRVKLFANLEF